MNKGWVIIAILSIMLIAGCAKQQGAQPPVQNSGTPPPAAQPAPVDEGIQAIDDAVTALDDLEDNGSAAVTIALIAQQFKFEPSTITVKKGTKVTLKITSLDVPHGFSIADFNVDAQLQPGATQDVSFVADKAGTFTFRCNLYCGEGHSGMQGTLVVEP
ncbi:cupredoxin domain-containing protein [Candidatus Woesearchaeota archaeon]|nr:cupredoxin domain-containing protein [Candidatus Woesearchaeota archaeon]